MAGSTARSALCCCRSVIVGTVAVVGTNGEGCCCLRSSTVRCTSLICTGTLIAPATRWSAAVAPTLEAGRGSAGAAAGCGAEAAPAAAQPGHPGCQRHPGWTE
ncbi:hypothetical protein HaLaN_24460 [Haematococcus lacustris]|uniref:Secreted protein n=1 Tax=Haematococcus lacustris TaxID=44745 RepID=A0A699ZTV5_HAELA|nr:hypothetical protein HaLaN_24460 [Haematococcus lacustris]